MINGQLNKIILFAQGDTAVIEGIPLSVQFLGAGSATLDNDDVLTDASFNISINGRMNAVNLEVINGRSSPLALEGYTFLLDFADGYSQSCGLIVSQLS